MRRRENCYNTIRIYSTPNRATGHAHKYLTLLGKGRGDKEILPLKLSKQIPQDLNMLTFAPTKQKVMQSKCCVVATKEFQVNHFGNATIEESSPLPNREILKMYSSIVWFCQKVKGSQRKTATDFKIFFQTFCSSSKAVPPVTCQASFLLMLQCQHTLPRWTAQVSTAAVLKDQSAAKCQCSYVLSCA